jgi:uncharacterized protein (UPF0548 family)
MVLAKLVDLNFARKPCRRVWATSNGRTPQSKQPFATCSARHLQCGEGRQKWVGARALFAWRTVLNWA